MRVLLAPSIVFAVTALADTTAWAQATVICTYGQTCQNAPPVPFPVINPVQGLNNVLTQTLGKPQPAPPPTIGYAPIATPPPVLPPDLKR